MITLDLYSRRGCHLCEVMLEELLPLIRDKAEIVVHDIDSRQEWRDEYDIRIPVLEHAGQVISEYQLDRDALARVLAECG